MGMLQKVVFLDRDGVINADSDAYIKNWSEFRFLPGSLQALRRLTANGFTLIVITNQSIINRQMVPATVLDDMHRRMKACIREAGGRIADIFYCPHTPDEGCNCRKPKPGLFLQALEKYNLEFASSGMIGDRAKDIEAAKAAGCGYSILVQSGDLLDAQQTLARKALLPDYVASNLEQAADWILTRFTCAKPPIS